MLQAENIPNPSDLSAQCAVEEWPIAERMATIMVDRAAEGCTITHLIEGGIPANQIDPHLSEAREIARKRYLRIEEPKYDRLARTAEAAEHIRCLMPDMVSITLHLGARGFAKSEMDIILNDAIAQAADAFAGEGH